MAETYFSNEATPDQPQQRNTTVMSLLVDLTDMTVLLHTPLEQPLGPDVPTSIFLICAHDAPNSKGSDGLILFGLSSSCFARLQCSLLAHVGVEKKSFCQGFLASISCFQGR